MIGALLYLQYHTSRNRLVARLTRLKQPKYLVGAIAGLLYFYFYFFRFLIPHPGRRAPAGWSLGAGGEHLLLFELLAALALLVVVLLAWIIPHERAALAFSEAEVAFLFPAPVSRRGLIHFKLLRSQLRIFFSVLFLTLISHRFGGKAWTHAAGWWLVFSTLNLHFLGCSFARTLLLDRGISNGLRRVIVLGGAVAAGVFVLAWARRSLPDAGAAGLRDLETLMHYAQQVLTSGPAPYLLYPFRLVVRPFLAPDSAAFLGALGPALAIFLLHYAWVILSDVAFEEASVEASQKLASKVAAIQAGNWQAARSSQKGRRPWFKLAPTGPAAVALLWKNLISAGQAASWRLWLSLTILCVAGYAGFAGNAHRQDLYTLVAALIGMALSWSLLVGPQFLRQDFRQDLVLMDVLKTLPMRGWQIALGEVLAPVVLLAAFQWLLLVFGALFLVGGRGSEGGLLPACALGAALVLPLIDAILLLIPNAAVLLFPSWIQAGRDAPRGIEATGQRLVFFLGQFLVLAVSLVPAAAVFAAVFFLLKLALGPAGAVPFAALAASVVLAIEGVLGLLLVGKLFERFDLSAESSVGQAT